MEKKQTYSTREFSEMFGITRSRLHQLRKGYTSSSGKVINRKLIFGRDWGFSSNTGKVYFKESARIKLEFLTIFKGF